MPVTLKQCGALLLVGALLACTSRPPLPAPSHPLVVTEDAPFRAHPPRLEPLEGGVISQPEVRSGTLANGLTLWVVQRAQVPYVALSLVVSQAGSMDAGVTAEVMQLTTRAVVEGGTVWFDGRHVEPPRLNGRGVTFDVLPMYSQFELQVVHANLAAGVGLLARTLQHPSFADGNLDPVRLAELNALRRSSTGLSSLMTKLALENAYGPEVAEQLVVSRFDRVREADTSTVKSCYHSAFNPKRSALIAVGDATFEEIQQLAEREFGAWSQNQKPAGNAPTSALDSRSPRRRVHLLMQGPSAQANVLILQPAPTALAEADELPFALLAEIAVGSFRSRANTRLRHEGGLTYGVHPQVLRTRRLGLLLVSAAISSDRVVDAILSLLTTLEGLRTSPVTEQELARGKVALSAGFERSAGNNASLATLLSERFAEGKPATWLRAHLKALAAVTAADVQRVAQKYLRPEAVEIGVAGDGALEDALSFIGEVNTYAAYRE